MSLATCSALAAQLAAAPASAQLPAGGTPTPVHAEVFAGGELERYLRVLQITGGVPLYPWSIRGFSRLEMERIAPADSAHPWAGRYDFRPVGSTGPAFSLIRPSAELIYNSAFPYGMNDGPIWAGRGITTAARAGFAAHWGALSLRVAPDAFYAQNADFELAPTPYEGDGRFAEPLSGGIDRPQRFGDEPYWRIDPGESALRVDLPYMAAGISTSAQVWGPGSAHPIILGNNAGGFPHAFLGTSTPIDLKILRIHGRLVWGGLAQSDYALTRLDEHRRFMSGIVAVLEPAGIGLEMGFARFYHSVWPEDGLGADQIFAPLEAFLKRNRTTGLPGNEDAANQLASVFARWAFPTAGFEIYGEFAREDHSWNARDLVLEPEHISGYLVGVQKAWRVEAGTLATLRAELLNTQISALERVRPQSGMYVHTRVRQGHTYRGQVLGSAAGFGGGGGLVAVDLYHPLGRWTFTSSRSIRNHRSPGPISGDTTPQGHDVMYTLDAEGMMFLGDIDLTARLSAVQNLNRNFERDMFNLNATIGLTWTP